MYDNQLWMKYYLQILMDLLEGKYISISFFEEPENADIPLEELIFKNGRYYVLTKRSIQDLDPDWNEIDQSQAWTHARYIADRWMLVSQENQAQIRALKEEIRHVTREVLRASQDPYPVLG